MRLPKFMNSDIKTCSSDAQDTEAIKPVTYDCNSRNSPEIRQHLRKHEGSGSKKMQTDSSNSASSSLSFQGFEVCNDTTTSCISLSEQMLDNHVKTTNLEIFQYDPSTSERIRNDPMEQETNCQIGHQLCTEVEITESNTLRPWKFFPRPVTGINMTVICYETIQKHLDDDVPDVSTCDEKMNSTRPKENSFSLSVDLLLCEEDTSLINHSQQ